MSITLAAAQITRSNAGALTTTFTAPAQCSTFGVQNARQSDATYWQAQTCRGYGPIDAASCWPEPGRTSLVPQLGGYGFYSPGLACPVGYATACTQVLQSDGSPSSVTGNYFAFQYPLIAGETGVGCCPSGMSCTQTDNGQQTFQTCIQIKTAGVVKPVGFCPTGGSITPTTYSSTGSVDIGTQLNQVDDFTITRALLYAPLIQLVWQATDVSSSSSSPSSSSSISSSTSSQSNPSITSSTQIQAQESDNSLSTSTKLAIGLGCSLGVLLILGLFGACVFFDRRRKRRRDFQEWQQSGGRVVYGQDRQQPVEIANSTKPFHELNSTVERKDVRSELPAN